MSKSNTEFLAKMRRELNAGVNQSYAEAERLIELAEEREAFSHFIKCKVCGGNNADAPCAYPEKHYENCMKNVILAAVKKTDK